jgi:prevent-host-death family protein
MKTYKARTLYVTEDILAVSDFKAHASKTLNSISENGRPVIITQNGKPAGVLISPEEFDRYREREDFVSAVTDGRRDVADGRTREVKGVESFMDKRFGKLK